MRRPQTLVLIFTASILLAAGALQVADLWWRHARALNAAEARAADLSSILAEYVRGSFALADTSLRQLVIHGRRVGGAQAPAEVWDPILLAARTALPDSGSVSVTDADGIIRPSTLRAIGGQPRNQTYVFKHLAAGTADELIVDVPFRTPNRYVVPVARRLETPAGTFDGIVVAVVMPEAFRAFFRSVDVGTGGVISVFHPDGVVLFREPSTEDPLGESAKDHPLLTAALSGQAPGVLRASLTRDGPAFVSSYRRLGSPPLVVAVSLNQRELLADWRSQVRTAASEFGVLSLTLAGLAVILFRQMNARTRAERELARVLALEAIRLRETNEQLAAALAQATEARRETEAASRLKDEFLMTLSHELRTPLNAIVGWIRMLTTGAIADDRRPHALAAIERNAQAQTRLVEDLLDVSRAIGGKLQLVAQPISVADVVFAAVETLRPAIVAKGISFETDVDRTLDPILADPDRLQQIVWNLLSNAIKFTPDRGTVQVRVAAAGSNVEIVVRDTGVGIAPEFLPYAFERFRQADARLNREFGGLGLGLSIARHLVEIHGGTLSAHSEGLGLGATFRVLLPRAS
ncbi:MAG: ATP-binding protein [Vicinamibacterales bacterium]